MLSRLPRYVLLAAFVTAGSALAARDRRSGRRPSHQAGRQTCGTCSWSCGGRQARSSAGYAGRCRAADGHVADSPRDADRAARRNLVFRTEAGKVVVGVSAPQLAEHKITDITKAGQVVTLKASTDYSGALTAFSGPVTMVLTLTPKGPDLAAWFDFNNSGFQIGGTAKKKA